MKTFGEKLNKVIFDLFDISKLMVKDIYERLVKFNLARHKSVYVITFKCNGEVKNTIVICGNEKDAIAKLSEVNNKVKCQSDKSFEIMEITPEQIREMLKEDHLERNE